MGYDLFISRCSLAVSQDAKQLRIDLDIHNQGVAPFYPNWPTEITCLDEQGKLLVSQTVPALSVQGILPTTEPVRKSATLQVETLPAGSIRVVMRVVHPLPNGKPLRFANKSQDQDRSGWLTLGQVSLP